MNPARTMPKGFEEYAKLPHAVLVKKYHCSDKQIARWRDELGVPRKTNTKPIAQYKDGELINEYPSVYQAARVVNGSPVNISNCAKGRFSTAYGFVWRYKSAN